MRAEWEGFNNGAWQKEINVRDFIQKNYTPYDGDESFLAGPTDATKELWKIGLLSVCHCAIFGGFFHSDGYCTNYATVASPAYSFAQCSGWKLMRPGLPDGL